MIVNSINRIVHNTEFQYIRKVSDIFIYAQDPGWTPHTEVRQNSGHGRIAVNDERSLGNPGFVPVSIYWDVVFPVKSILPLAFLRSILR